MSNWVLTLVWFFVLSPIAINVANLGGKPIDLNPSDLLIFLAPFFLLLNKGWCGFDLRRSQVKFFVAFTIVNILYGILVSFKTSVEHGGALVSIASAIRFYKPLVLIFVGMLWSNKLSLNTLFKTVSYAIVLMTFTFLISDIIWGNFPIPRWGDKFFNIDVYGFPNSPAAYYGYLLIFLFHGIFELKHKWLFIVSALLLTIITIMTLSRTALIIIVAVFLFSLIVKSSVGKFRRGLIALILFSITTLSLASVVQTYDLSPILFGAMGKKLAKVAEGNDALSGREKIWMDASVLISKKPVLGYGFEPFSNYNSRYETPHQQYLEIAFKTGILGFVLYFIPLIVGLCFMYYNSSFYGVAGTGVRLFVMGGFIMMIGSFTQPNFSYSVFANTFFLLFGIIINSKFIQVKKEGVVSESL